MISHLLGAAKRALDIDTIERRIAELPRPEGEFGVDPFGFTPEYIRHTVLPFLLLYKYYFRVKVSGIENVPNTRCLLISNHSGQLPYDAVMINSAVFLECDPPRVVRSMVDRFVPSTPFISYIFPRMGQIVGTPENARRLLERDEALLVFPEGVRGLNKTWEQRYCLQDFGLGFMRLAMETGTPIVPISVVGAEEQAPSVYNFKSLGKLFGSPAFAITPFNPVPVLGLIPLPTRYYIHFGQPLHFEGDANEDDDIIREKVTQVKSSIQASIDDQLARRQSVFF